MSCFEIIHLFVSAAVFIVVFWANDDEPFLNRVVLALIFAVLWLPALIMLALMMLVDGVVALAKRWRK